VSLKREVAVVAWIGACLVVVFLIGAIFGRVFSRQPENAKRDQSHSDKVNYPAHTDQETSLAALARAQIAAAKDSYVAAKDNAAHNERSRRIGFWTAIGVGVYTVFTAVIVVFNIVQYGETHRFNKKQIRLTNAQLSEMRSSSRQTDQTIAALREQAGIMNGQLDERQTQERPWVTITDPPEIISPLIVRSSGISIDLLFSFRNTGHSPSIGVLPDTRVILNRIKQIGDEFARVCDFRNPGMGVYVFPGDTPTQPTEILMPSSDIDGFWKEHPTSRPIIAPVIFVCVVYWEPTSHKPHHTPFAYELMRKHSDSANLSNAFIFVDEGDVSIDNLFLRRQIVGLPSPD